MPAHQVSAPAYTWGSSWPCCHHHRWAVPSAELPWATWPHGPARWCHAALPKMTQPPAPSGCQWPLKQHRPHRGREGSGLTRRKGLTLTMENTPASFCRLSLPLPGHLHRGLCHSSCWQRNKSGDGSRGPAAHQHGQRSSDAAPSIYL